MNFNIDEYLKFILIFFSNKQSLKHFKMEISIGKSNILNKGNT